MFGIPIYVGCISTYCQILTDHNSVLQVSYCTDITHMLGRVTANYYLLLVVSEDRNVSGRGGGTLKSILTHHTSDPHPHTSWFNTLFGNCHTIFSGRMPYNRHALRTIHLHTSVYYSKKVSSPAKKILYETLPITGMITEQMLGTSGCIVPLIPGGFMISNLYCDAKSWYQNVLLPSIKSMFK